MNPKSSFHSFIFGFVDFKINWMTTLRTLLMRKITVKNGSFEAVYPFVDFVISWFE